MVGSGAGWQLRSSPSLVSKKIRESKQFQDSAYVLTSNTLLKIHIIHEMYMTLMNYYQ